MKGPARNYSGVRNIGYIWSCGEGSNYKPVFLDLEEVGFDSILQRLFWGKRSLGGAGALHVAPDQFVRVQFRCIAGQEDQLEFASRAFNVVEHNLRLVRRQTVENEEQRSATMTHDVLEHCHK